MLRPTRDRTVRAHLDKGSFGKVRPIMWPKGLTPSNGWQAFYTRPRRRRRRCRQPSQQAAQAGRSRAGTPGNEERRRGHSRCILVGWGGSGETGVHVAKLWRPGRPSREGETRGIQCLWSIRETLLVERLVQCIRRVSRGDATERDGGATFFTVSTVKCLLSSSKRRGA